MLSMKSFAVPVFLALAVVILAHMSVKHRRRKTGQFVPAPSYLKVFALVATGSYIVIHLCMKNSRASGYRPMMDGGGPPMMDGGGPTMEELMRCIDISDPAF
jgi:hypothetical protein